MDLSSLPEAQKQQLQQLQQQFQEHQQQQQQEAQREQQNQHYPQDYASSQQYDQSQIQPQSSYDQSYYSYYQQNPQQPQQNDYYSNAYQQQSHLEQHFSQPESVGHIKPAGSAEAPLSAGESGGTISVRLGQGPVQLQQQQNAYYPQHVGPGRDQLSSGFPGMNPAAAAAVAALSQLTHFAGTMGSAERAIVELQGYAPMMGRGVPGQFMGPGPMHYGGPSPQYRVGGRRGGDPYRRGGHGNFRNRGRGHGMGRGIPSHYSSQDAASSACLGIFAAEEIKSTEEVAAVPLVPEKGNAAPTEQRIRVAWCELCRVDCNSMEILEQHKNGKKHKKNLQRSEEVKKANQPVAVIQSDGKGAAGSNPDGKLQPENVQEGEENKLTLPEKNPIESVIDEHKVEAEHKHNQVDQPQNPGEGQSSMLARQPGLNQFDNQRPGMKRKMRGGRGGKRMKTSDASRRPIKPSKHKVVIPLICDLCNVKCDTQEVFDRHVSGKKHISKLKRFEGHQAMYGPLGLQALYPPNPIAQTFYQPQGHHQTYNGPHSSYPPPEDHITAQVHPAAQAAMGIDSGFQQNPNQLSDCNTESGVQKAQPQSASVEPVANQINERDVS